VPFSEAEEFENYRRGIWTVQRLFPTHFNKTDLTVLVTWKHAYYHEKW
jgi:hypothetical protein